MVPYLYGKDYEKIRVYKISIKHSNTIIDKNVIEIYSTSYFRSKDQPPAVSGTESADVQEGKQPK